MKRLAILLAACLLPGAGMAATARSAQATLVRSAPVASIAQVETPKRLNLDCNDGIWTVTFEGKGDSITISIATATDAQDILKKKVEQSDAKGDLAAAIEKLIKDNAWKDSWAINQDKIRLDRELNTKDITHYIGATDAGQYIKLTEDRSDAEKGPQYSISFMLDSSFACKQAQTDEQVQKRE